MDNIQDRKLGAGIITICIINLIVQGFLMVGYLTVLFMNDLLKEKAPSLGLDPSIYNRTATIIPMILSILVIVSVILIFCKKALGVYGYFISVVLITINSIITAGFSKSIFTSLIFPALMAYFIYKKKSVFGFASKEDI